MPARRKPPKPTIIAFVRHGLTPTTGKVLPGRARGLHLAEQGRAQAQAAADRLSACGKVAAVYASPLERARETAAPIGKAFGLRVTAERGLLECNVGDWTGLALKEVAKLPEWQQVQRTPSMFRFPGGESFLEMQARTSETVRRIVAAHPGELVVCVSHADPIKVVVADAMGSHLDHFQRFALSPCSITVIAYSVAGPHVLCVNTTDKLPGAA